MALLSLFAVAFVGSVFWVVNPELTAIYYASELRYPIWLVALVCAVAQTAMYILLFWGGERLLARWRWLRAQSDATLARFGESLGKRFLWVTGLGAVVGVPPCSVLSAMAPSFSVRFSTLIPMVFCARVLRFSIFAVAGEGLVMWVRQLF